MELADIADDRVHGATYVAGQLATLLLERYRRGEDIRGLAIEAARAQPAMGSVVRIASEVLHGRTDFLIDYAARAASRAQRAAACAAKYIPDRALVMTHSASSVVETVLLTSHLRPELIVPESRPLCEGVAFATRLAASGLRVRVIADAAVVRFMREATLVLTGADAVSPAGVTNKIGTAAIALAAREYGKPMYVVCTSDKWLGRAPTDRLRAPEELVRERAAGIAVANYYFDTTPLDWITGIITEEGLCSRPRFDDDVIHPELR